MESQQGWFYPRGSWQSAAATAALQQTSPNTTHRDDTSESMQVVGNMGGPWAHSMRGLVSQGTIHPGPLQEPEGFLPAAAAPWAAGYGPVVAPQQVTPAEALELNALRVWFMASQRKEKLENELCSARKKVKRMHEHYASLQQENAMLQNHVLELENTFQSITGRPAQGLLAPPLPPPLLLPGAQEAHDLPAAAAGNGHANLVLQASPPDIDSAANSSAQLPLGFEYDGGADCDAYGLLPDGMVGVGPGDALPPLSTEDVEDLLDAFVAEVEAEAAMQQGPTGAAPQGVVAVSGEAVMRNKLSLPNKCNMHKAQAVVGRAVP